MKSKLKTHKATAKRIKVTGQGKFIQRTSTQDHFNSREPGKKTRSKRLDHRVDKTNRGHVKKLLPYS